MKTGQMGSKYPRAFTFGRLQVSVVFFDQGEKCRKTPPILAQTYRPHFVVKGTTTLLGVCFLSGEQVVLGKQVTAEIQPMYEQVDYHLLTAGAEFFIQEGPNQVGEGIVLAESQEVFPPDQTIPI